MYILCSDLEGVLIPEIWIAFAEAVGIDELKRTTRDEPDYDKLMNYRLEILRQKGLGIRQIQDVIATIDPMPGAREYLDRVREWGQCIIISDTFSQFAKPLMKKLGYPTLFCNELIIDDDGTISGYRLRCPDTKLTTVRALHDCGLETIAVGDSLNDIAMIRNSSAGWLFRTTEAIKAANPDIEALESYDELFQRIVDATAS